jgi:hypothetical protein
MVHGKQRTNGLIVDTAFRLLPDADTGRARCDDQREIVMRKLIMWNLLTLDGMFEGPRSWDLDWHQSVWDPELEKISIEQLRSADMLLFGRTPIWVWRRTGKTHRVRWQNS